jgi:hypothetical protein
MASGKVKTGMGGRFYRNTHVEAGNGNTKRTQGNKRHSPPNPAACPLEFLVISDIQICSNSSK